MIFGIGIDVLKVDRVERVYEKHGERFVRHLFDWIGHTQFARTGKWAPTLRARWHD